MGSRLTLTASLALAGAAASAETITAHACFPGEDGNLTGVVLMLDVEPVELFRGGPPANSITILDNGPSSNRYDLVFVGDGYTASEQGLFAQHAQNGLDDLINQEPFLEYASYFNAHIVEVISNESGVDNDPNQGISRDTALDMGFWCGGTERALCVNTSKALQYATNAPEAQQTLAVANSTKYGGVGYPSLDLGTFSGGNGVAPEIAIHELGHSMGDLADEYTYGGSQVYGGSEPSAENVSIYDEQEMLDIEAKWHLWIGDSTPGFDGPISTYEGGNYSEQGIYRPSPNSKMRNLGRPFNLPGVGELVLELYREVNAIDEFSPASGTVDGDAVLSVTPMQPATHDLDVSWFIDGTEVATGVNTLDVSTLGLSAGNHSVVVRVTDPTPWIRDEMLRLIGLSDVRTWLVRVSLPGDITGDGQVNFSDLNLLLALYGTTGSGIAADIDGNGIVGFSDLNILLSNFGDSL